MGGTVYNLMLGGGMMPDGGVISRLPREKVHYQVETRDESDHL